MLRVIGFAGPKGSGKTTYANEVVRILQDEYKVSATRRAYADPLKRFMKVIFNFTDEQLGTWDGKETVDNRYGISPRKAMQKFGTEYMRKLVPDFWVDCMRRIVREDVCYGRTVIIDDIRFENEAALVRELGGVVIHLTGRRDGKPYEKSWKDLFLNLFGHKSERPLMVTVDDVLVNNYQDGIVKEVAESIVKEEIL